jgi:hypothetical protein
MTTYSLPAFRPRAYTSYDVNYVIFPLCRPPLRATRQAVPFAAFCSMSVTPSLYACAIATRDASCQGREIRLFCTPLHLDADCRN